MSRRVDRRNKRYDARLSCCDWCRDFGPEDFNGKHVVVFMSGGSIIRGALTCMGTVKDGSDNFENACDRTGFISLEGNGFPALHDGHGTGEATDLAVLKRLRPGNDGALPPAERRWGFAEDVEEVVFVWDEQDYDYVFPENAGPGCMAVVGAEPYPVLAVDDDWIVIDMDVPIAFHRNLVAEFLSAKTRKDPQQGRTA